MAPPADSSQYPLRKIVAIWVAATALMVILGWIVTPMVGDSWGMEVGLARAILLTIGLIWQTLLALLIVRREAGDLRWVSICRRLRLNAPLDPVTAQPEKRLWWWLLPLGFAFGGVAALAGAVDQAVFSGPLAFVAEPDQYSLEAMVSDETRRSALRGAWWLFAIFVPMLFFNILGEELLFRGVLLPKMTGVFGQGAWFANGVMFAFYHLHQPWGIPATIINGSLFAWAAHRFRSTTIAMIVHGAQTIIILILVAAIVLGSIS